MHFSDSTPTPVTSDVTVQLDDYTVDDVDRKQSSHTPHLDHKTAVNTTTMTSFDAQLHGGARVGFSSVNEKRTPNLHPGLRRKTPHGASAGSTAVTLGGETDRRRNVAGSDGTTVVQQDGLFQGEPRQSLLGRPLSVSRPNKRDIHYRRYQARIYNFLERPKNVEAIAYHLLV